MTPKQEAVWAGCLFALLEIGVWLWAYLKVMNYFHLPPFVMFALYILVRYQPGSTRS